MSPSAIYLNALIAKLVHMSRDVGRDWHTGQEFPLRASQDVIDAIRESADVVRLCRNQRDHIASLEAENARLVKENERIRAALAQSDQPCAYCSLPAEEWNKCQHGFPGCDRADDAMGCPELGASMRAEADREALRVALEPFGRAAVNWDYEPQVYPDDDRADDMSRHPLTVGDFRRARALTQGGGDKGEGQ